MWHTMILFVASQVSRVCFQIQKSDNLHGCNIIWLTNVMLMVTTVHCTNAPSRVWIFNSKTSVNCSWALHRPPHPHKGCSCHGDTRAVNGMKGDTATHRPGTKGEMSLTPSAFSCTPQLRHCAALPYLHQHTPQGQQGRGVRSCRETDAQHPHASSSCSQQPTALVNEATLKTFMRKHPGLQRVLQTK